MFKTVFDVGICRETRNSWERRAPLTPKHVAELTSESGLRFAVQPSELRAFKEDEYRAAGAVITEDLSQCRVVLGVKEMPLESFREKGRYAFFAHVIKGQEYNMPMLRRMAELGCDLVDYEMIRDDAGRRLVFFGHIAGIAGAAETLRALGLRLAHEGLETPFAGLLQPYEYESLDALKQAVADVGQQVRRYGLPERLVPLVIGVTGYGNVGNGAVELLDELGAVAVEPSELPTVMAHGRRNTVYRVVFREEHFVEPLENGREFELKEYYQYPERFRPVFDEYLPYLTVLANCIFWTERYPRLVTRKWLKGEFAKPDGPRLKVIGDISCDRHGAIEATVKGTEPGNPVFVYDPDTDEAVDGVEGRGMAVMAVYNLPCELPFDSSAEFGDMLKPFVPGLAREPGATGSQEPADLSGSLARALVLRGGGLTEGYRYLARYLDRS